MSPGLRRHRSSWDLTNSWRWRTEESGETLWPQTVQTGYPNAPRSLMAADAPTFTSRIRTPWRNSNCCGPQRYARPPLC